MGGYALFIVENGKICRYGTVPKFSSFGKRSITIWINNSFTDITGYMFFN